MTLFQFYFLQFTAVYILLGWALYAPFRADQIYFGALYSMCIGAYFAAYASIEWNWPLWLILMGAIVLCLLFSLIPAYKLAALGGLPMLIATMALLTIVQTATRNMEILGGRHGLFGVPFVSPYAMLAVTYGMVLIVGFIIYRLDYSHVGRSMDALHLNRDVASAMGINVTRLSMELQLLSSAIGGVAGVLYAFTLGGAFPEAFGASLMLYSIAIVAFGGMYTMWGVLVASPILWGITQFLPQGFKQFSVISYSVLLIVVLLIRPQGLIDRKTVRAIVNKAPVLGKGPRVGGKRERNAVLRESPNGP